MFEISFLLIFAFLIIARLSELVVSKRNEDWLIKNGGIEYGKNQYPYMVSLHVLWFISLAVEKNWFSLNLFTLDTLTIISLSALTLGMGIRIYSIKKLEKYWCAKVIVIPSQPIITNGLYKYFKHPNYFGVWLEVLFVPLIFKLYFTALLFAFLKIIVLYFRIKTENLALEKC